MLDGLRNKMLAVLRVPPEPQPPLGDPASLRVFHAGQNYLRLRLGVWAFAQLLALTGIIFWTAVLIEVEATAHQQSKIPAERSATGALEKADGSSPASAAPATPASKNWAERLAKRIEAANKKQRLVGWSGFKQMFVELALLLPPWTFRLIWIVKIAGFVLYLLQIPITYAVRRLDYEMRWYMVTDRSLRLRHGVWKVSESTMSFANIQQVAVSQGPLQRLLGLADVKVKSAGGGSARPDKQDDDLHTGLFHSVTNANQIRDLILDRLRRFRETGLGDPDDQASKPAVSHEIHGGSPLPIDFAGSLITNKAILAANDLLAEAKALRDAVGRS